MIDYHLVQKRVFNEEFVRVLKKYAVILAVMLLLSSAAYMLIPLVSSVFSATYLSYYSMGINGSMYLINLITAIILYFDMSRLRKVSWSIIGLTLLSNEVGVLFFLLYLLCHSMQREDNEISGEDITV